MAKQDVLNKIAEVRAAVDAAKVRILEDVEELRRLIAEGASTADVEAALDAVKADVVAIDPDPAFPVAPAPAVEPEL